MEITDRLYGQLSKDDAKTVVTGLKIDTEDAKEALINEILERLKT